MGVKSFYISLLASLASLIGPVHIFALSGTMWQVFSDGQNRAKQIVKKNGRIPSHESTLRELIIFKTPREL